MSKTDLKVLIVEDSPPDVRLLIYELRHAGFVPDVILVETEADYRANLNADLDVVLCDYNVVDLNAQRALELLHERYPEIPFLIVSGSIGDEAAVELLKYGAFDYLLKDRLGRLGPAVRKALYQRKLHQAERRAQEELRNSEQRYRLLAESIPQLVWTARPDGGLDYLNQRALDFTGCIESGLTGWNWQRVVHPDDLTRTLAQWTETIRSGQAREMEFRIRGADGAYRWHISRQLAVRDQSGGVIRWFGTCTDIHDHKAAAEQLARDAMLLARVQDSIIVTDLEGIVVYWNAGAMRLFGWTAEEMVGRPYADRFDESIRPSIQARIRELIDGSDWNGEFEDYRKDGSRVWIHARVSRILDSEGRPTGVMGVSHDISGRKRAEDERDRALRQLRLQVERMPLAYVLMDANLHIVDWNASAERIFGYTREEILGEGSPFPKLIPPNSMGRVDEVLRRVEAGDMQAHSINENLTKTGSKIICEWHNTPLLDDDGNCTGILSLAQDITSRLTSERELNLRDRAIQAVTQGILITDPSQPDNPVIYASSGFLQLSGYSMEEVIGRNCRFMQGQETDPQAVAQLREAIREGHCCTVELLNYRKDGTSFWNEVSIAPLADGDKITHFVGVQTDVTQRRRLDEQFRQSQKMEGIGRLAGSVAHDFNNLLTVINGYCEIILSEISMQDPSRASIVEIHNAGAQAACLTAQLLAFSRKSILEHRILDLNEVVEQIGNLLGRLLGADLNLSMFLSPDLSRVKMNLGQIEQMVMNLAVNARDAMPPGGCLSIETHDILVEEDDAPRYAGMPPGRYVQLVVSDTGHGMTDAVKARIFEPFFTTKGPGKGTGLGLATVFGIVQQARGHISVDSEVGRGSIFTVLLPALLETPEQALAKASALPARGNETVLLVEDEESVRSFARTVLQNHGYRVLEADSAAPAIRMLDGMAAPIQLLLTDVVMPGMGGRELADALRAVRPDLRVLYISGYTDDAEELLRVDEATHNFLQKPFTPLTLARKVRAVLDERP